MRECNHNCAQCAEGGADVSGLTADGIELLCALEKYHYLPVARFATASSREEEAYAVALEPVYIADESDSMEAVKAVGALFQNLADRGLISLDYDLPLGEYAYAEYKNSALYAYFVQTVREAAAQPDCLFDVPLLETGSVALTCAGRAALAGLRAENA